MGRPSNSIAHSAMHRHAANRGGGDRVREAQGRCGKKRVSSARVASRCAIGPAIPQACASRCRKQDESNRSSSPIAHHGSNPVRGLSRVCTVSPLPVGAEHADVQYRLRAQCAADGRPWSRGEFGKQCGRARESLCAGRARRHRDQAGCLTSFERGGVARDGRFARRQAGHWAELNIAPRSAIIRNTVACMRAVERRANARVVRQ